MHSKLTCPDCEVAFALAKDVRGEKVFCPVCGKSLVVTDAGAARRNRRPVLGRGANPLWHLLIAAPLLVLIGGLCAFALTRDHHPIAKLENDRPPPTTAPVAEVHKPEAPPSTTPTTPVRPPPETPPDIPPAPAPAPVPAPAVPVAPRPSDKLASLLKNNELLPAKAISGKPFTFQLPKVDGAHVELHPGGGPTGLTISPDGKLTWLPPLGLRTSTYPVIVNIKPGNALRTIKITLEEDPETALALPGIGGWAMLPDGATLIVVLPESQQLAYIDTVANKELKRVKLSFKPYLLALQGKRLFVSGQEARSELHVLDRDSGESKKTITLPGAWLTELVCHREKGPVYGLSGNTLVMINPDVGASGTAEPMLLDQTNFAAIQISGSPDSIDGLTMDPVNAGELYGRMTASGTARIDRFQTSPFSNQYLVKFGIVGKTLKAIWAGLANNPADSLGRNRAIIRVSVDGKRMGASIGAGSAGGNVGISLYDVNPLNGAVGKLSGVADCGQLPADLAFHPVLDIGVAQQNYAPIQRPGGVRITPTVMHVFNCKTLNETSITLSDEGPPPSGKPSYPLLTFGSLGTKLLYYDGVQGYLRSFPLALTDKDKESLAKIYHTPK
jgi:hypothetical protein